MALPTGYHVQILVTDGSGNLVKLLPISTGDDVKIDDSSLSISAATVQELVDSLGDLAFEDSIPGASTSQAGIVQLSNNINDTSAANTAATTKAVSTVNNNVVHTSTNESIAGVKTFTDSISLNNIASLEGSIDTSGDNVVTMKFN